MSKAEKHIREHTRNCSNEYLVDNKPDGFGGYISRRKFTPWLTPDQAREAVEIAREEIYKWLENYYRDYMHNPTGEKLEAFFGMDMITDLKQAMKDENVR